MNTRTETGAHGAFPAFIRAYWMLLGYLPLFISILSIPAADGFSWRDGAAAAAWLALLGARAVDVFRLRGTTADGAPATPADFRAFAVRVTVVVVGAWLVAHAMRVAEVL